jgi:hypothetical protein
MNRPGKTPEASATQPQAIPPTHGQNGKPEERQTPIPKWLDPNLELSTHKTLQQPQHSAEVEKPNKSMADEKDKDKDVTRSAVTHKKDQQHTTMQTTSPESQDASFSVEDQIYLEIKSIADPAPTANPYAMPYCHQPGLKFLSELYRTGQESQHLLKPIADRHTPTANYLKSLNKRLELLQQFLIATSQWADLTPNCHIALSENGLVILEATHEEKELFHVNQVHVNQAVHLQIMLFPGMTPLCMFGRVIGATKPKEESKRAHTGGGNPPIHIRFYQHQETEQQILAKHILQKQITQRLKRQIYL